MRRLSGALEADEHDDRWRLRRGVKGYPLGAENVDQLIPDDADHLLGRRQRLEHLLADRALPDRGDEVLDDLEVDVRLQQGAADLSHRVIDVLLGELSFVADALKDIVEAIAEGIEHG